MIDVHCRYFGHSGGQVFGHEVTRALARHTDIALHPWDEIPSQAEIDEPTRAMLVNARRKQSSRVGLGIGNASFMKRVEAKLRIGFTVWETTRIPELLRRELMQLDEVWIPSHWGKRVLADNGIGPGNISVVPEGVNPDDFPCRLEDEPEPDLPERPFRFLCVAKWERRKGLDVLLDAYSKAFTRQDDVELVLHCSNPYLSGFDLEHTVRDLVNLCPAPVIASPPKTKRKLSALYRHCDAFVLPTRGEGWGLPICEAMASGLPVIVTEYSAPLDFVSSANGYLIEVDSMEPVDDPKFFVRDWDYGEWANPSTEHLIELMRGVYRDRISARNKGLRGRRDIVDQWTWRHAGQRAWARLEKHGCTPR